MVDGAVNDMMNGAVNQLGDRGSARLRAGRSRTVCTCKLVIYTSAHPTEAAAHAPGAFSPPVEISTHRRL